MKIITSALVAIGLSVMFVQVLNPIRRDWPCWLRFMIVFGKLDWLESPHVCLAMSEVLIAAQCELSIDDELTLVRPGPSGTERILLFLDEPLLERMWTWTCTRWRDEATPLRTLDSCPRHKVMSQPHDRCVSK